MRPRGCIPLDFWKTEHSFTNCKTTHYHRAISFLGLIVGEDVELDASRQSGDEMHRRR
jgi:hypothetical protein